MKHLRRFLAPVALTTLIIGGFACGDVGGDVPGDAGLAGGSAGAGGNGATGGTGASKPDGSGGVGAVDVASEPRVDVSVDVGGSGAAGTGSTIEAGRDSADVRAETGADGTGGASGASGAGGAGAKGGAAGAGTDAAGGTAGAGGAAGASGSTGTGGSAGATGTGGASGASGTGGAAGAGGSTADASIDVGSTWDGAIIIEGGRDAPTTTTDAILTAASADCDACMQESGAAYDPTCDLATIRCEAFPDLARQLNCLDTLACVLPPGSAVSCVLVVPGSSPALTPCYCGTVSTEDCIASRPASDGGVYGACKGYIDVGFAGQNGAFVANNLTNIDYGSGRAMQIARCAANLIEKGPMDTRCQSCF